jgi:hypothetical protein
MAADSNMTVATTILHIGMVAPMALSAHRPTLMHRFTMLGGARFIIGPQSSEIGRRRQAHAQAAALMEERNAQRVK